MIFKQNLLLLLFFISTPIMLRATEYAIQFKSETELLQEQINSNNRIHYLLIVLLILALAAIIFLYKRTQNSTTRKQSFNDDELNYHEIFEYSLDTIITTDSNGIITNANQAIETMLDYSPDELIGKDIKLIYESEDEYLTTLQQLRKNDTFSGEILNKTKDGKIIITRLSANQIRNQSGEIIGTMGISRDITEESLLREEYDRLINNVSDIIYKTDINGNFTYANNTVQSIAGYSPNEFLEKSFKEFIHDDDFMMVANHYIEVFQKRIKKSYLEFRIRKKNGESIWVGQHVNTQFNQFDGSIIEGYYGVLRVIEERKKAEFKLQKSEKRYRELINNSSDLVQIIDPTGKLIYVNQAWKETLNYSKQELKGVNVFNFIHPESIDHCMTIFEGIKNQTTSNNERTLYSLVSKEGDKITVEGSFNAKYDEEGNVISVQSFLRNVTLQKEAEELLSEKENTLRQIAETISDVFYLYNIAERKYEYVSPNCEVILGANEQFFYDGKDHTAEFGYPGDVEKFQEARTALNEGISYDINYRIVVNGEIRWINEKSFAIRDENGNIVSNSGICRDVTEITEANKTIRIQNLEIGSSILYAKRIQDAVLPSTTDINSVFPDSFVIFRPKDVVSGDFYIVESIRTNDNIEMPTFIVGDCTGHGVPGAVLSLMCNVLLRESFKRHDVNSPAEALDYVRARLTNFFSTTEEKNIRDGMDISFCVVDDEENKLRFSGANSNCVLIRNGEMQIFRGNRQHVGYDENPSPFLNHSIDIIEGDRIYLYSDGFTDQFGGEKEKKFGKLQLHSILKENANMSMNELGELLAKELDKWQGNNEQVDDITILGIQI